MALEDNSLKRLHLDALDLSRDRELRGKLDGAEAVADLDGPEIQHLSALLKAYRVPANTVLFREGEPAGYIGIVLDGRLGVVKRNEENAGKSLYSMAKGKVFGEMAILDGEPRSATVMAETDAAVAILSRDGFEQLCRDRPVIALKLLRRLGRLLSQRLRRASGLLVDYLP